MIDFIPMAFQNLNSYEGEKLSRYIKGMRGGSKKEIYMMTLLNPQYQRSGAVPSRNMRHPCRGSTPAAALSFAASALSQTSGRI